jgi:hypothetical protein
MRKKIEKVQICQIDPLKVRLRFSFKFILNWNLFFRSIVKWSTWGEGQYRRPNIAECAENAEFNLRNITILAKIISVPIYRRKCRVSPNLKKSPNFFEIYISNYFVCVMNEPIVKLLTKLKNCLTYDVISNARAFSFFERDNLFLFSYREKFPMSPNVPISPNLFAKKLSAILGPPLYILHVISFYYEAPIKSLNHNVILTYTIFII